MTPPDDKGDSAEDSGDKELGGNMDNLSDPQMQSEGGATVQMYHVTVKWNTAEHESVDICEVWTGWIKK